MSEVILEETVVLRSYDPLAPDAPVALTLVPPGKNRPYALTGRVVRLSVAEEGRVMEVRLTFEEEEQRHRYAALVARLEGRFLRGDLPDDVLA